MAYVTLSSKAIGSTIKLKVNATLIVKGKKTLDQVPALIRKQVEEILKDLEVEVE